MKVKPQPLPLLLGGGGEGTGFVEKGRHLFLCRDTFDVFLKQLQHLPSTAHLSSLETERISALLGVVEEVFSLASLDPSQLRLAEGGGGQLPPPAVLWVHAAGMFPPLLHALHAWAKDSVESSRPDKASSQQCM